MCVFQKNRIQDQDPVFKILICRIRIRPKMDPIRNPAFQHFLAVPFITFQLFLQHFLAVPFSTFQLFLLALFSCSFQHFLAVFQLFLYHVLAVPLEWGYSVLSLCSINKGTTCQKSNSALFSAQLTREKERGGGQRTENDLLAKYLESPKRGGIITMKRLDWFNWMGEQRLEHGTLWIRNQKLRIRIRQAHNYLILKK